MLAGTFQKFREYLRILPNKYYDQIKGFYIYHTSLFLRSYLWFEGSKKAKFWKKKTIFMGEYFLFPKFYF